MEITAAAAQATTYTTGKTLAEQINDYLAVSKTSIATLASEIPGYSWGDVDVKIPGLVLVVQEISYDDEQDMEESYGKGNRPRGYGKGNYKASGKMSMLRDDYDDVLAYCKAKGVPFYGLEWPSVVVSYANEGERTRIDELKKVVPIKRSHKAAQGDKSLTVDIDLMIVGGIVEDGVEPTK